MASIRRYNFKYGPCVKLLAVTFFACMTLPIHATNGTCEYDYSESTDVVFIIDGTRSIPDKQRGEAMEFIHDLIQTSLLLRPDNLSARMAVILFGEEVLVRYNSITKPKNIYQCELFFADGIWTRLLNVSVRLGKFNLLGALDKAATILESVRYNRPITNQMIWLFTDAKDFENRTSVLANEIKKIATIYSVGLGHELDETYLRKIATTATCHYHKLAKWKEMLYSHDSFKPHPQKTRGSILLRQISNREICLQYCQDSTPCYCDEFQLDNDVVRCKEVTSTTTPNTTEQTSVVPATPSTGAPSNDLLFGLKIVFIIVNATLGLLFASFGIVFAYWKLLANKKTTEAPVEESAVCKNEIQPVHDNEHKSCDTVDDDQDWPTHTAENEVDDDEFDDGGCVMEETGTYENYNGNRQPVENRTPADHRGDVIDMEMQQQPRPVQQTPSNHYYEDPDKVNELPQPMSGDQLRLYVRNASQQSLSTEKKLNEDYENESEVLKLRYNENYLHML